MTDAPPSTAALVYRGYLERLARLDGRGEGDGPEADALRDLMDGVWRELNPAERASAASASERLFPAR